MATPEQVARALAALGVQPNSTQFTDEGVPTPDTGGHIQGSAGGVPITPKEQYSNSGYSNIESNQTPTPINPDSPDETSIAPDVPAGREESRDFSEGVQWENALTRLGIGPFTPPAQLPWEQEYSNYFPGGGPEGKAIFEDTFKTRPAAIAQASEDAAAIEKQFQDARAKTIADEKDRVEHQNAEIQLRHQTRMAEVQQQHQQIQEKVQFYTNDLADTGKFWRNPGNLMAAFGAALMTLASDDHAIGYKLINNAIQQDLHQRQKLADMHLGELRSNLAGYRQMAGDEFSGDLLAEAEAKRVAAMELERLGAQFAGPKAQATAKVMSEKFRMDAQNLQMQFYHSLIYNKQRQMTLGEKGALQKGATAYPGVGATPYGSYPGATQPQSQPTNNAAGGGSLRQSNQQPGNVNPTQAQKNAFRPSPALMEFFNKRLPSAGTDIEDTLTTLSMEVAAKTRALPNTPQHTAGMVDAMNAARKEAAEKGDKFIEYETSRKGWSHALGTMKYIEASLAQTGMNPDQWNGWLRDFTPDGWAQKINGLRIKWNNEYPPGTPAAKKASEQLKALERFHQMLASSKVEAYHAFFGGAMNPDELKLAKEMLNTDGPWQNIRGFVEQQSKKAAAQTSGYNMSPLARIIAKGRAGQDYPQVNTKETKGNKELPKTFGPPK